MSSMTPIDPSRKGGSEAEQIRAAEKKSDAQFRSLRERGCNDTVELAAWLEESRAWLRARVTAGLNRWSSSDGPARQLARKASELACDVDLPHTVRERVVMPSSPIQDLSYLEVLNRLDIMLDACRQCVRERHGHTPAASESNVQDKTSEGPKFTASGQSSDKPGSRTVPLASVGAPNSNATTMSFRMAPASLSPERRPRWHVIRIRFDNLLRCMRQRPKEPNNGAPEFCRQLTYSLFELGSAMRAVGIHEAIDQWETAAGPGSYAKMLIQLAQHPTEERIGQLLSHDMREASVLDSVREHIEQFADALLAATEPPLNEGNAPPGPPGITENSTLSPVERIFHDARRIGGSIDVFMAERDREIQESEVLREVAGAFDGVVRAIYEQKEFARNSFDPLPHLREIDRAIMRFCALLAEFGRAFLMDVLDFEQLRRQGQHGLADEETNPAGDLAVHFVRTALARQSVFDVLSRAWIGPDATDRQGVILRASLHYVGLMFRCFSGQNAFPLPNRGFFYPLDLVQRLRSAFQNSHRWTSAALFRAGFDLNELDLLLGRMHINLPRPRIGVESSAAATEKFDKIIEALQQHYAEVVNASPRMGQDKKGEDPADADCGSSESQTEATSGSSSGSEIGETDRWLTVRDAAVIAGGCNSGTITRAVDAGQLKGNGEAGRKRRIDAIDLTRWIKQRAGKPEPSESDAQVEKLARKHLQD